MGIFILVSWAIIFIKPFLSEPFFLLITGGIFFLGIACSEIIVSAGNVKDPQYIVIDE